MSQFFLFKTKDLEIPPFFTVLDGTLDLEPPIAAKGDIVHIECDESALTFWLRGMLCKGIWMAENTEDGWYIELPN